VNSFNNIERTASAYDYQLLIKHLLTSPIARALPVRNARAARLGR